MSKYNELKSYLPDYYENIAEMQSYLSSLGAEMDKLDAGTMQMRLNNFLFLADEPTLSRFENFLYISYDSPRTIEERRQMIASFFVGGSHIGAREIKDIVKVFTPSPCEVVFANSTIDVRITRDIEDSFILSDCYFMLLRKRPGHLNLVITIISPFDASLYIGLAITEYKEEVI